MTCDKFCELISEGQPSNPNAQQHLQTCDGCRAMIASLTPSDAAAPNVDRIQAAIAKNMRPVRPLPSNLTLMLLFSAVFFAFALTAAMPVGYFGFRALSSFQKMAVYSGIAGCALSSSALLVSQMIPGSKRVLNPALVLPSEIMSLIVITLGMFHSYTTERFVLRGIGCLRLGTICAFGCGALAWLLLRKGFFTSPPVAGLIAGSFAGFAGFAVLALHCPILNVPHILVWHLGVLAIAVPVALIIALVGKRYHRVHG